MADGDSRHRCVAIGCQHDIPGRKLMCNRHWAMVPRRVQRAIWAEYRLGQEDDRKPSAEYIRFARQAIVAVARKESPPADDDGPGLFG